MRTGVVYDSRRQRQMCSRDMINIKLTLKELLGSEELVVTLLQKLPKHTFYYKDCLDLKEP